MPRSFWEINNELNHSKAISEFGISYTEKDGYITVRSFEEILGNISLSEIEPDIDNNK